jgi:hypothetical protein
MRQYSENIRICIQNMDAWINQLLPLALQLSRAPFGPEMKPIIDEMAVLGDQLFRGLDQNGNRLIEPIEGECGVGLAYEQGWYMVDMPIYIGPDRVPPSGK